MADALAARSIEQPFKIQSLALPDALAGLDVLAKSPTGSGKTLVFAIPIVERTGASDRRPSALVLVPTRELAVQVTEDIATIAPAKSIRVASVYGGVPLGRQAADARKAHVLVATPGRLEDLAERRMVDLLAIRILVLDEADRMLDLGFKPQVDRIVRRIPQEPPDDVLLGHARRRGRRARRACTRPARHGSKRTGARRPTPGRPSIAMSPSARTARSRRWSSTCPDGRACTLVFVRTKRGADRLTEKLARHGIKAEAMHGDLSQRARQRALERFESGKVRVLVATDVAARGLDIDGIEHVDRARTTRGGQGVPPAHGAHRPRRPERPCDHIRAPRSADGYEPSRQQARASGAIRRVWHGCRSRAGRLYQSPRTAIQVVDRADSRTG